MVRAEKDSSTSAAPHRRRKRVIALIVLAVIVLLIWSMPYLVSSGMFDGLIFGAANDQLNGTVHWQGLSLSWLGPCRVEHLVLTDAQGRTLADVEQIEYSGGLWHAIWSPLNFGTVSVRRPQVTVYVDESPQSLLAPKAQDADDDEDDDEDSGPAKPIGTLAVTDGRVRLVRADNSEYELTDIGATLTLQTLNDVGGKVHVGLGGGGAVSMELQLTDLLAGGAPGLKTLVGSVKLASDEAIQLGPLTAFIDPAGRVDGAAGLRIDARLDKGKVDATLRGAGKALRSANKAYQTGKPIDVSFSTVIRGDEHALNSDVTLAVAGAGSIWFKAAASEPGKMQLPAGAALLAAVLEGTNVTLPNVTLTGGGEIHLAPIAQAVPSVLNVLPEVSVQSGTLAIKSFSLTGGVAPEAAVSVTLSELSARKGKTQLTAQPVSLDVRAALRGGQGLVVTQANLASSFATLTGSGTPEKMTFTLDTDLVALRKEMGQVFDLSALPSAGTLSVSVNATQPPVAENQPRQIEMTLRIEAMGIEQAWKDKHLSLGALSLGASVTGPTDFHTFHAEIQSGTVRGLSLWGKAPSPDVMDLAFGGQVTRGEKRFDAEMDLAGDVHPRSAAADVTGEALLLSGQFGMEMPSGEAAQETAAPAGLMAYLFEGRSPAAPQFDVKLEKATGRIDIPALLRALPALGTSFEPWAIREAVLTLERADLRGGAEPSASLAIQLYPLSIGRTFPALKGTQLRTGELVLAQPWRIRLTANAGSEGLRIQTFALQERLADAGDYRTLLDASFTGPARQPVAKLTADLTALHSRLRPILGADVPELTGSLESSTTLTRTPQGIEFDGKLSARGLVLTETPAPTGTGAPVPAPAPVRRTLGDLQIAHRGSVTLAAANNELTAFKVDSADVTLGKDLSLNASGAYEVAAKRYRGTVVIGDVRIAPLLAFVNSAGARVDPGASYGGSLSSTIDVEGTAEQVTTSGNLAIADLSVNGRSIGGKPTALKWVGVVYQSASGAVRVPSASVSGPLAAVTIEKLAIQTDVHVTATGNVAIEEIDLEQCWAAVRPVLAARKPAAEKTAEAEEPASLPETLKGTVTGNITLAGGAKGGGFKTNGRLSVKNLVVDATDYGRNGPTVVNWTDATFTPDSGKISLPKASVTGPLADVAIEALAVQTGEEFSADGKVKIVRVDLAACWPLVRPMLDASREAEAEAAKTAGKDFQPAPLPQTLTGILSGKANFASGPDQTRSNGNLAVKNLSIDQETAGAADTTVDWTDVVYQAKDHRIAIARAAVGGPLVDVLIEPLTVTTGEALAMDGSVTLTAVNLGPIWPLVQPMLERARQRTVILDEDGNRKKPGPLPETLEGLVRGRVTMTPQGGVTTIRTVSRDNPDTAAPLTITNLRVVADNGAQWKENITLQAVARLNPADKTITVDQISAASDPIATAATTAPAARTFELQGGNIRIEQYDSDTEMLIRTGTADFKGDLGRLQTVSAALAPDEPSKVQQWLGKVNPIFAKSSRIEGLAVLDTTGIVWPRDLKRHAAKAAGSGTLTFNDFRITPKGLLAEILKLGGPALQDRMPAVIDPVTFVIRDGKVHCDSFVIHFGKDFDLRFSGDVGLDDSLDMKLSLPVSAALLEKYGVKGPALEYFTAITGERLTVPIRGTTSKPAFKVTLADLQPMIQRGLQKGLLNKVLDNVKKPDAPAPDDSMPKDPADAEKTPAPATQPARPEERIKDTLLDLLRQQMNKGNDTEKK